MAAAASDPFCGASSVALATSLACALTESACEAAGEAAGEATVDTSRALDASSSSQVLTGSAGVAGEAGAFSDQDFDASSLAIAELLSGFLAGSAGESSGAAAAASVLVCGDDEVSPSEVLAGLTGEAEPGEAGAAPFPVCSAALVILAASLSGILAVFAR